MPTDRLQAVIDVGSIVNIPCVVTAVADGTQPTVTLETLYKGFDGNKDTLGPVDAIQVTLKE